MNILWANTEAAEATAFPISISTFSQAHERSGLLGHRISLSLSRAVSLLAAVGFGQILKHAVRALFHNN